VDAGHPVRAAQGVAPEYSYLPSLMGLQTRELAFFQRTPRALLLSGLGTQEAQSRLGLASEPLGQITEETTEGSIPVHRDGRRLRFRLCAVCIWALRGTNVAP
jgi:hypothetical protein